MTRESGPRILPLIPGAWVVARRELISYLTDRSVVAMNAFFVIGFPALIGFWQVPALMESGSDAFIVVMMAQLLTFPFVGGMKAIMAAFAGERERGTLGPLLLTPLSNGSIFVGKVLAVFLPTLFLGWVGLTVASTASWFSVGDPFAGIGTTVVLRLVLVATIFGALVLLSGILIGLRTQSERSSSAVGTVLLTPLIALVAFAAYQLPVYPDLVTGAAVAAVPIAIAATLYAAKRWRREEALAVLA